MNRFILIDEVSIYLLDSNKLPLYYYNSSVFVILLSRVYFGNLVTKIHYSSPLNNSAQLRT